MDSLTEFKLTSIREPSTTCDKFKIIRSNIEKAITPLQIAGLHLNLVQSLATAQPVYYECLRSKVLRQGHRVKGQGNSIS